jgi:hypothetical protein
MKDSIRHPRNLFIAALLIIPAIAILVMSLSTGSTKREGPSSRLLDTGAQEDNAILLKKAAQNMRDAKSYTLDANIKAGNNTVTMKCDFDTENNKTRCENELHVVSMKTQVIVIADIVYRSKDSGKSWTKLSGTDASQGASPYSDLREMWDKITNAELDKVVNQFADGVPATEVIEDVNTRHITGDLQSLATLGIRMVGIDSASEGTVDFWISMDGAYVSQMKVQSNSDGLDIINHIKWGNFGEAFTIEAPTVFIESGTPDDPSEYLLTATPVPTMSP